MLFTSTIDYDYLQRHTQRLGLVATNGCFDLFHAGHLALLRAAKAQGLRLVVGVDRDVRVRALKGEGRPIIGETDRAAIVMAMREVDDVVLFNTAIEFLYAVKPAVWVKGGDWTMETLNPAEVEVVKKYGGRIVIVDRSAGISTTDIINRIK